MQLIVISPHGIDELREDLIKQYNAIRLAYPDTAAAKEAIRLLKQ